MAEKDDLVPRLEGLQSEGLIKNRNLPGAVDNLIATAGGQALNVSRVPEDPNVWGLYKNEPSLADIQQLSPEQKRKVDQMVKVFLKDVSTFYATQIKQNGVRMQLCPGYHGLIIKAGELGKDAKNYSNGLADKIGAALPPPLRRLVYFYDQAAATNRVKIFQHPDDSKKYVLNFQMKSMVSYCDNRGPVADMIKGE